VLSAKTNIKKKESKRTVLTLDLFSLRAVLFI